jgi:hypothetical protein
MSQQGKIRIEVSSRTVPARIINVTRPVFSTTGSRLGDQTKTMVVYETSLDDSHRRAVQEAKRMSCSLGLDLEVVDRAKSGIIGRMASALEALGA